MRAIIQRVSSASCSIEGKISGEIGLGFMILLGIEDSDTDERSELAGTEDQQHEDIFG